MKGWVKRFDRPVIFIHWTYAIAFLALVTTGIGFEFKTLSFLLGPTARLIHRSAAVLFVFAPLVYLTLTAKAGFRHLVEAFRWTMDDVRWLIKAPGHYMLGKGDMPAAGYFNAGQKLNYMIVVLSNVAFTVSGAIMWFGRPQMSLAQRDLFRWAAIVHEGSFFVGASMFALHLYLSLIHPFTKTAITAMMTGYVTRAYAALHHGKWLDELEKGDAAASQAD